MDAFGSEECVLDIIESGPLFVKRVGVNVWMSSERAIQEQVMCAGNMRRTVKPVEPSDKGRRTKVLVLMKCFIEDYPLRWLNRKDIQYIQGYNQHTLEWTAIGLSPSTSALSLAFSQFAFALIPIRSA